VLIVIDAISAEVGENNWPGSCMENNHEKAVKGMTREKLEKSFLDCWIALLDIYRFSHVAVGDCGNPHEDFAHDFLVRETAMIGSMIDHPEQLSSQPRNIELPMPSKDAAEREKWLKEQTEKEESLETKDV
jgi:hypothetical protein